VAAGSRTGVVLVSSTAAAAGDREDLTGPEIRSWLSERGFGPLEVHVVADADIAGAVAEQVRRSPTVLLTTGGTGVAADDRPRGVWCGPRRRGWRMPLPPVLWPNRCAAPPPCC